ncbi:hypothetical protein FSP39_013845 [Pinctada imbricata]|uniref:Uncharacterized protein n=1 Tax=Pinctada imbricata TaxID=66713 RepID=A0AA88YP92_PINIB|nr:hypothetical protein FSP39_013845 [Pinctada imbricata]
MRGQGHMQKVATEPAPSRNHSPLLKKFEDYGNLNFDLTKTVPRGYQRELFTKAMEGDTVLFLPTGTGKTLISCLAVSAMLTQNPTRQVVFLVDKVLLVIQQSRYLINELGDRNYTRFDPDNVNSPDSHNQLMDRKLRIAALCGGQQSTGGVPLWKHDLIIVTAAFYENLLSQGVLKWTDLSLVVFDEAHHCGKNHPFNRLLQEHQLPKAGSVRPKVLGLTASPAGRPTVDETLDMLKYFMANLGHAKMAIVEKNKTELESYQSNALVKVITAESSAKEESLRLQLQLYLLESYTKFCAETDMLDKYNLGLQATSKRNLSKKELIECAETLEGDLLNSLEVTLDKASPKSNNAAHRLIVANLSTHIKYVCYALNSLFEAGVPLALEELQILMAARESSGFEFAKSLGLKCDDLLAEYDSCQEVELSTTREMAGRPHLTSKINCLIKSLLSLENIDWRKREERPMALVLVKQRSTAKMVCSILQSESMVKSLGLSVVYVVGHGAGSAEGGMTVSQQKRLLEEVKAHRHQIIVATSVAEEGIDIPECQLVVSMNPPSTVTALVQMRGRARKIQSKFVIICTDVNEKAKMEDLQLKENNMTKATAIIVREQRQQR